MGERGSAEEARVEAAAREVKVHMANMKEGGLEVGGIAKEVEALGRIVMGGKKGVGGRGTEVKARAGVKALLIGRVAMVKKTDTKTGRRGREVRKVKEGTNTVVEAVVEGNNWGVR